MNFVQKETCRAIVNIFETGKVRGDYGAITVMKGDTGHLSYGRSQTTLGSGNLFKLLDRYCSQPGAKYAQDIEPYLPKFSALDFSLDSDENVKALLQSAGKEDPVMQSTQDLFFDQTYFAPACNAAETFGVTLPLGIAVVYDSHIQGGWKIVSEGVGKVNDRGEKDWIQLYIETRRAWLATRKPPVPATVYRMDSFSALIQNNKWDLALPINVHGVTITEESLMGSGTTANGGAIRILQLATPYLRGDDVKALQEALAAAGFSVSIDGVYGPHTDALVIEYKEENGIEESGAGPLTRRALNL
jgi:chitosanase